jgi:hypothetical protein
MTKINRVALSLLGASVLSFALPALAALHVTPAKFVCHAPQSLDLEVKTSASGHVKVTVTPGDTSASGKLDEQGSADIGQFISEDHGEFTVKLDAAMLRGEAGSLVLTDSEPGDEPFDSPYACDLATH